MIRRYHLVLFFVLVAIENMAANFAHPITPTLIKDLSLPDYSFGLLYAGMAFTNFLFSPFWAKQVKRIGSRSVLLVCCAGYGVGQFLFSVFTTLPSIMIARLLSGFFVGGIMVSFLTYVIHHYELELRARYLALLATFSSVFGAFGYLIGGIFGVFSIKGTFLFQSFVLIACGVGCYFFLREDKEEGLPPLRIVKDANPFQAFIDSKSFMSLMFMILFIVVFITSTASTAYDQCFNYYIKDQFHFNSSYNGILKAVVGLISLVANTTICMWIIRKTDVNKALVYVLGAGGIALLGIVFLDEMFPFILMNIVFFAINAIYIPLLQDLCAQRSDKSNAHMVMGFYNAMKSLGMIAGSLFAGFIYVYGAKLSFFYAAVFFFVAMLGLIIYHYRSRFESK